jgi:hypothetical protein
MAARRQARLCFNCDEPFSRGHKCKLLFDITVINSYDTDDSDNSFMMMIGTANAAVRGCTPMYLTGVIAGTGVFILVDTGATHNIIDINVARLIGLREQRIDTTILVGSGNEVTCQAASFSTLLRVDDEVFTIDAFLLDIGNDIDVVLGTPWLASLGRLTWDFTMELQYHERGRPITLTSLRPQCRPTTVLALPAPGAIRRADRQHQATPSPPRGIALRASRSRHPNALDHFGSISVPVFTELRTAVLQ